MTINERDIQAIIDKSPEERTEEETALLGKLIHDCVMASGEESARILENGWWELFKKPKHRRSVSEQEAIRALLLAHEKTPRSIQYTLCQPPRQK